MALSNYPKVLKYAIGDRPYYIPVEKLGYELINGSFDNYDPVGGNVYLNGRTNGFIRRCKITGWRTEVYSSDGGTTGVQENYYTVKEITGYDPDTVFSNNEPFDEFYSPRSFEVSESELFPSPNAAVMSLSPGEYLNYAYNGDTLASSIFRNWGLNIEGEGPAISDWFDWAGMDFRSANLGTVESLVAVQISFQWKGSPSDDYPQYIGGEMEGTKSIITDGCNFTGATMPSAWNSKANFRTNVFSYDEFTTLWTDGLPIGRS